MRRSLGTFGGRLLLITALALVSRVAFFGSHLPTADDYLVSLTADAYLGGGQPYPVMPFHPVLRNLLTALSMEVFGRGAIGLKFFSVLFGTLMAPITGLFVRRATGDERAGLLAALFVAVDIVLIGFSRQAIQEVHSAFFSVLGAWLAVEALRADDRRAWRWLLPLAGIALGLGAASKLYSLAPLAVSVVALGASAIKRREWSGVAFVVSALGLVPLTVYLATYVPWFGRGYDFSEWVGFQAAALEAMAMHTVPLVGYLANSRPALWFLAPLYSYADFAVTSKGPQLAVAVGNPLVWLAVIPAAVASWIGRRDRRGAVLLLAYFLAAYLPLAASPRPVWLLSAVSVAPFGLALVASVAARMTHSERGARLVLTYVALVLLVSATLYPLTIGRALEYPHLQGIVESTGYLELSAPNRGEGQ